MKKLYVAVVKTYNEPDPTDPAVETVETRAVPVLGKDEQEAVGLVVMSLRNAGFDQADILSIGTVEVPFELIETAYIQGKMSWAE